MTAAIQLLSVAFACLLIDVRLLPDEQRVSAGDVQSQMSRGLRLGRAGGARRFPLCVSFFGFAASLQPRGWNVSRGWCRGHNAPTPAALRAFFTNSRASGRIGVILARVFGVQAGLTQKHPEQQVGRCDLRSDRGRRHGARASGAAHGTRGVFAGRGGEAHAPAPARKPRVQAHVPGGSAARCTRCPPERGADPRRARDQRGALDRDGVRARRVGAIADAGLGQDQEEHAAADRVLDDLADAARSRGCARGEGRARSSLGSRAPRRVPAERAGWRRRHRARRGLRRRARDERQAGHRSRRAQRQAFVHGAGARERRPASVKPTCSRRRPCSGS